MLPLKMQCPRNYELRIQFWQSEDLPREQCPGISPILHEASCCQQHPCRLRKDVPWTTPHQHLIALPFHVWQNHTQHLKSCRRCMFLSYRCSACLQFVISDSRIRSPYPNQLVNEQITIKHCRKIWIGNSRNILHIAEYKSFTKKIFETS